MATEVESKQKQEPITIETRLIDAMLYRRLRGFLEDQLIAIPVEVGGILPSGREREDAVTEAGVVLSGAAVRTLARMALEIKRSMDIGVEWGKAIVAENKARQKEKA